MGAKYGVEKNSGKQKRKRLPEKRWGVFQHEVVDRSHPLVADINTRFDVPHSRYNEISREQFEAAGLRVLVESPEAGVHLAVSEDLFVLCCEAPLCLQQTRQCFQLSTPQSCVDIRHAVVPGDFVVNKLPWMRDVPYRHRQ